MADDPGTPTIFGWDASDYDWDRGPMDVAAARADGIDFFTHKATEATGTKHAHYGEAMRRARDAGIPVLGAYHVVRSPRNAAAEVDFHLSYVDWQTPWWRDFPNWFFQVDLEVWPYDSVPAAEGEDFADLIEARTGRKAIIYASRGQYGNQLTGTSHELWNANYGSNSDGHFRDLYAARGADSGAGWAAYSGRTPVIWQYASRATIGRQNICDANAFRGTLAQLTSILNGDIDMPEWFKEIDWLANIWRREAETSDRPYVAAGPTKGERNESHFARVALADKLATVAADVEALKARPPVQPAPVDPAVLAAAIAAAISDPATLAAIAKAVNDDSAKRQAA